MPVLRTLIVWALCGWLSGCGDSPQRGATPQPKLPTELTAAPDFSGDNAYVHCAALCALGPRPSGSEAYRQQVEYLEAHLRQAGWVVWRQEFEPLPGRKMTNLHAQFGSADSARPLILTCHIDTKGQGAEAILGADDGASGAAVILETARILAQQPELAGQVELVFYDGEESFGAHITDSDGLFGSRYDAQHRDVLPRYQINLDMVGGEGKVIVVPIMETSPVMYEHYLSAIRALKFSEDYWSIYPGSFLDDHMPFAELGVDTLNLIADFSGSSWWHTKRDDMRRIAPASLRESGLMALWLIRRILGQSS